MTATVQQIEYEQPRDPYLFDFTHARHVEAVNPRNTERWRTAMAVYAATADENSPLPPTPSLVHMATGLF